MWIITPDGFISAVAHRTEPDTIIIRARDRGDIKFVADKLRDLGHGRPPIEENPRADYLFRLTVPHQAFIDYAAWAAANVDYANVKDEVKARQGAGRANIYMRVWSALLDLQPSGAWGLARGAWRDDHAALDDTFFGDDKDLEVRLFDDEPQDLYGALILDEPADPEAVPEEDWRAKVYGSGGYVTRPSRRRRKNNRKGGK